VAIILLDFDGTVVPKIPDGYCDVDTGAHKVLLELIQAGHLLVLWTCRNNSLDNPYNYINGVPREETCLSEAVKWFESRRIPLYGINSVPNQETKIGYSKKLLGDIIIDDTALGIPLVWGNVDYISYDTGEIIRGFYTHCVDWIAVEAILKQRKLI
jgi:hypothetical protein